MRDFKRVVSGVVAVAAVMGLPPAVAEESTLAARVSRGLATVNVTLGTTETDEPQMTFVVHRPPTSVYRVVGTWIGPCLPDAQQLKRWQRAHPKHPARRLWARALARKQYEALVFLRTDRLNTVPDCTTEEAMSMRHTDVHPDFAAFARQAKAVLPTLKPLPLTPSCGLLLE